MHFFHRNYNVTCDLYKDLLTLTLPAILFRSECEAHSLIDGLINSLTDYLNGIGVFLETNCGWMHNNWNEFHSHGNTLLSLSYDLWVSKVCKNGPRWSIAVIQGNIPKMMICQAIIKHVRDLNCITRSEENLTTIHTSTTHPPPLEWNSWLSQLCSEWWIKNSLTYYFVASCLPHTLWTVQLKVDHLKVNLCHNC